ncbi:MAG: helix-turn-helix domain-containing protein [Anaerolineae bacterium]|jgi:transcriptional regulator with XRE-family HTH domain|nr:helix-turn-helix domain-containing protein [Chloroflexota bacterium]
MCSSAPLPAPPATAAVLAHWRQAAGLSRQRLAELADVSATYVRTIERGHDDLGRPVVPSAAIMGKLASALAAAFPEADPAPLAQQILTALMDAAGYLTAAPSVAVPSVAAPSAEQGGPRAPLYAAVALASDPCSRTAGHAIGEPPARGGTPGVADRALAPAAAGPLRTALGAASEPPAAEPALALRDLPLPDPRLRAALLPVLAHWGALPLADQDTFLGLLRWLQERLTRTDSVPQGGRSC